MKENRITRYPYLIWKLLGYNDNEVHVNIWVEKRSLFLSNVVALHVLHEPGYSMSVTINLIAKNPTNKTKPSEQGVLEPFNKKAK